jgi:hypothetical protein
MSRISFLVRLAPFLTSFNALPVSNYLETLPDVPDAPYPERFIVQALLILNMTLGDWSSSSPLQLPESFIMELASQVVGKFLPMRASDIQRLGEDVEEFLGEEEAERWEFELRVSALHRERGDIPLHTILTHEEILALRGICRSKPPCQSRSGLGTKFDEHVTTSFKSVTLFSFFLPLVSVLIS